MKEIRRLFEALEIVFDPLDISILHIKFSPLGIGSCLKFNFTRRLAISFVSAPTPG